jgi:hypothetical protein
VEVVEKRRCSGEEVRAVKLSDIKSVTARARSCWGSGAGTNSSGGELREAGGGGGARRGRR